MGFIRAIRPAVRAEMDARDFIWVVALGSAARTGVTLDGIRDAIDRLAGTLWSPVADLVGDAVEEMVRGGHLGAAVDRQDGERRFAATAVGLRTLAALLRLAVPRPLTAMGQVALRLKLAFVDLLPADERRRQLEAAVAGYETELADRRGCAEGQPMQGDLGRRWFDHDTDRLRRDLALLRSMAASVEPAPALH